MEVQENGFMRAKVINNIDPEMKGRIQVFIPEIMGLEYDDDNDEAKEIEINTSPNVFDPDSPFMFNEKVTLSNGLWADPIQYTHNSSADERTGGQFIIPRKDEWIFVIFEGGDIQKPKWLPLSMNGSAITPSVDLIGNITPETLPNIQILHQSVDGQVIYFDTNANTRSLVIKQLNGGSYKMRSDSEGNNYIELELNNNRIKIDDKDGSINLEGDSNINIKTADTSVKMTKGEIKLQCGSSSITITPGGIVFSTSSIDFNG